MTRVVPLHKAVGVRHLRMVASIQPPKGTVALRTNDADPAHVGAMSERRVRRIHVVSMHLNTGLSAQLTLRGGFRGFMQQCQMDRSPNR